jgi:hypothetical protein
LKIKDANESDTVTAITDIMQDIFGYDKYTEITSEYAIGGGDRTRCDLAIIDAKRKVRFFIEAKGVSIALNESHIRQAVEYGAREGVSWVILTNAEFWQIYKIKLGQSLGRELIYEFNLLKINTKNDKEMEAVFVISKDGQENSVIDNFYAETQIKNRFVIGALLNNDEVYTVIRRNMRKLFDNIKISEEEIASILKNDIIKREIIESEEAIKARKDVEKAIRKQERTKAKSETNIEKNTNEIASNNEEREQIL